MLSLGLERQIIMMIIDDEIAEIPPVIRGTIAANLVQAEHISESNFGVYSLKMALCL